MLGGPVYIAMIRYAISLVGTIVLFSLMSESRFDKKDTVIRYACFGTVLVSAACIWYAVDWESSAKTAAIVMYLCFCCFAGCIPCGRNRSFRPVL